MIKISVDTEEELQHVRRVLKSEACSHNCCPTYDKDCCVCIDTYCEDKVRLYKREVVEEPAPIVV